MGDKARLAIPGCGPTGPSSRGTIDRTPNNSPIKPLGVFRVSAVLLTCLLCVFRVSAVLSASAPAASPWTLAHQLDKLPATSRIAILPPEQISMARDLWQVDFAIPN